MAEMGKTVGEQDIARDIFETNEVESKTELRVDQVERINKLKTLGTIFNSGLLDNHLRDFMILQKSKDRQGLKEFIQALKSKKEELIDKGKMFLKNSMG